MDSILKHKNYLYLAGSCAVAIIFSTYFYLNTLVVADAKIIEIHQQYAADFSDDRVLVGASHNIFVGRVVRQVGTKERGIGPETQFEVKVVDNIKGDLQESVIINQQGGYKDGVLYVVGDGDVVRGAKERNNYLLQVGSTYLLSTRYSKSEDWYTLNPYPTATKRLSDKGGLTEIQLKSLAELDTRVKELKSAYPNEVLLDADIKHNNTPNSYRASFQGVSTN